MSQIIQVDLTLFRFLLSIIIMLICAGGVLIAVGKLLNKQKTHCKSIKILDDALWDKGRPLLQSIKICKEEREELKKERSEFKSEYKEGQKEIKRTFEKVLGKLVEMDKKQDEVNEKRSEQIVKIQVHMQKIDTWYEETYKR